MSKPNVRCRHCTTPFYSKNPEDAFCCTGCEAVYSLLHRANLGAYYDLKSSGPSFREGGPVESVRDSYAYMDTDLFKTTFCFSKDGDEGSVWIKFYIEGVHCVACIWLLEKLHTLSDVIVESRVSVGDNILMIRLKPGASPAVAARLVASLGYVPHPIESNSSAKQIEDRERRDMLVRIGVAGACLGNIMILAVSLYAGADGVIGTVFEWVSLVLTLPIMFYSAVPFYKSAWGSVKHRVFSIDISVTVALWLGFIGSVVGLFHSGHVYFDSIAMFCFLLLSTRYVLKKLHQQFDYQSHFASFLFPPSSFRKKVNASAFEQVLTSSIVPGDVVKIEPEAVISVDGTLMSHTAVVDEQILTGESLPKTVYKGETVYAGTRNVGDALQVSVTAVERESRVGKIFQSVISSQKPRIVVLADKIASVFLPILLGVAAFILIRGMWTGTLGYAVEVALALIMVACPCALALATPLAYSMGLQRACWDGILIKNADTFETLRSIQTILFDKTGTLTTGKMTMLKSVPERLSDADVGLLYGLEVHQKHPIAKAIVRWIQREYPDCVPSQVDRIERVDHGLRGYVRAIVGDIVGDVVVTICQDVTSHHAGASVVLSVDGRVRARLFLEDPIREGVAQTVSALMANGYQCGIVSGDHAAAVAHVADQLGISMWVASQTPDQKVTFVCDHPNSLMVGDGANDAPAMAAASVSVAVKGSLELSIQTADCYFTRPGLSTLQSLLHLAKNVRRGVRQNLVFSLFYNGVGIGVVLMGIVSPIVAAVLMPISSISVYLNSYRHVRHVSHARQTVRLRD